MEIKEVQKLIKNINEKELQVPIMLVGATGIGKSGCLKELVKDTIKENKDFGFVDLRLATMESTDLIGIPHNVEGRTLWAKPDWFPKEGTKGILALEEVNRATDDVRQGVFQLLTEWRLHSHELPKGWSIVALINPDNGQYQINQLDIAFKRRFVQLEVTSPSAVDWAIWGNKNGITPEMVMFVNQFPQVLTRTDDKVDIDAINTPSGLEKLDILYREGCIPHSSLLEVASGIIGREYAVVWLKSLKNKMESPLTAEDILNDFSKKKLKLAEQIKNKSNDLIYYTMTNLMAYTDEHKLKEKQIANLGEFLTMVSEEYCVTIIQNLIDNNAKNTDILTELSKNKELLGRIKGLMKDLKEIE